jgi:hypothetical protein
MGQEIGHYIDFSPSGSAAIMGFSFFFAAVFIVKSKANRLAKKNEYRPKVVKILR